MKEVHLECKPDEALSMCLGVARKLITHHNDKGRVCNSLKKHPNVIGMVDEDPGAPQPEYLRQLPIDAAQTKHGLRVLRDHSRQNTLIVVCPRLEDWIVDVAGNNQVKLKAFGLPDKPNDLHKIINTRLEGFKNLVKHLLEKQSEPILHLQRLLSSQPN